MYISLSIVKFDFQTVTLVIILFVAVFQNGVSDYLLGSCQVESLSNYCVGHFSIMGHTNFQKTRFRLFIHCRS